MSHDPATRVIAPLRAAARARHGVRLRSKAPAEADLNYLDREYIRALERELSIVNQRYRALAEAKGAHVLAHLPANMVKTCGAYARSTGKPCIAKAMKNGRCRNHGGMSTGPKTPEGRTRALANLRHRTLNRERTANVASFPHDTGR